MKPGTFKPRTTRLKRYTRLRLVNPERAASEFKRCYHSRARKRFVKWLPCIVTGQSPCDNAHTKGDGGSRKADYDQIVPLTRAMHDELHRIGVESFQRLHGVNLEQSARETEALWKRIGVAA